MIRKGARVGENFGERLAVIETLLHNHLKHHERFLTFAILPILVGVAMLVIDKICSYIGG